MIGLLLLGCKERTTDSPASQEREVFNQELLNELNRMAEVDQIAAYIPRGKYKDLTAHEWNLFKDSVFTTHQVQLKKLFDRHGFLGFDLVGEEGSQKFWLMVQHCDHTPDFQMKVLKAMEIAVKNRNAQASNYGLLMDRVRINTGGKQVYGTQVVYNTDVCQAYPKPLEDSMSVNKRRELVGLEPLEIYLNRMSVSHFEMNKQNYESRGINAPKLYVVD